MQGDQRQRSCNGCSRNVFNISEMTKQEAESFLRENGTSQCMIFYRRKDGTIMTDNCPVGLRKLRDRCRVVVRAIAGLLTFMMSSSVAMSEPIKVIRKSKHLGLQLTKLKPGCEEVYPNPPGGIGWFEEPPKGGFGVWNAVSAREVNSPANNVPDQVTTEHASFMTTERGLITIESGRRVHHQPDKVKVKLHAERVLYMDDAAVEIFKKGQECVNRGQLGLAEEHFARALMFFDAQERGDKKFRELIEKSMRAVQSQSQ